MAKRASEAGSWLLKYVSLLEKSRWSDICIGLISFPHHHFPERNLISVLVRDGPS